MTLAEIIDKLDRTTNQYNVVLRENQKLSSDVKTLQADNALLFKKIVGLQDEIVQMMNKRNEEEEWIIGQREEEMRAKRTMSCIDTIKEKFEMEVTGKKIGLRIEHMAKDNQTSQLEEFKMPSFTYAIPSRPAYKKVADD